MAVSIANMVDAFRQGLTKCTFRARLAVQFLFQHAVASLNGIADGLVGSDTERRGARACGMPAGWGRKRCCSVRPAPRRDPRSRSEVAASCTLLPDLLLRRHRRSDRRERRWLATFTRTAPRDLRTGRLATGLLVARCDLQAGKLIDAVRRRRAALKQMTLRVVLCGQALDASWIGSAGEHGYAGAASPGGNKGDGERQLSVPMTFDGRGRHSGVLRPATAHPDRRLVDRVSRTSWHAPSRRDCRSEGMIWIRPSLA